ncbi:ashwin [Brachyhypopomus gauderio]|uniref:ashwin n=1 Tax=Brachyhypopomus gauderio TaxID=698409 RepID=UPI00404179B0
MSYLKMCRTSVFGGSEKRKMASYRSRRDAKSKRADANVVETDLMLHPELLSRDFIKLLLHERKIRTDDDDDEEDPDQLTDLYIRHVIPLPQRELPNTRWGKRMENTKVRQRSSSGPRSSADGNRKRPLIEFDGSSTRTGGVKLKKDHDHPTPPLTDRLKPPPSAIDLTNPIRKLSGSSTNCSPSPSLASSTQAPAPPSGASPKSPTGNGNLSISSGTSGSVSSKLKREAPGPTEAPGSPELKSPEMKKKIQHVTWP